MAAIDFLWHDHPLRLTSVLSDAEAHCFLCLQFVTGYSYKCPNCNFYLHISCLKIPLESAHPLHNHLHPLTLLTQPPQTNNNPEILCDECKDPCSGLTYNCSQCPFSLHRHCALKPRSFSREIHGHPLTFSGPTLSGSESVLCNVCGEISHLFNLCCQDCRFAAHIECSALPASVVYSHHEHPLSLISVQAIEDGTGEFYCYICEESINVRGSIYYCADCIFIGHVRCIIASAPKPQIKLAYRETTLTSADKFDQSRAGASQTVLIDGFNRPFDQVFNDGLKELRLRFREHQIVEHGNAEQNGQKVVEHFSHEHPLILDFNHEKENTICYACWGKIPVTGYYGCSQNHCNFFLHKWCAEIPIKIQHPIHPDHPLTLLSRSPNFQCICNACDEPCDGFIYNCKSCFFNLHVMCASIPRTLVSGIHQHPLTLCQKRPYSTRCRACNDECTGTVFECEICNLVLDFKCGLLPHTVRHQCHIDPLTLTSLVEDDAEEYYCSACEKLRMPNSWVYFCADCEYTAHVECVVSELVGGPPKAGLLQFDHHQHLLSLITSESLCHV